jgi:hypothetical protein
VIVEDDRAILHPTVSCEWSFPYAEHPVRVQVKSREKADERKGIKQAKVVAGKEWPVMKEIHRQMRGSIEVDWTGD